jgi:CheY-like chemotaxis protein
MNTRSLILIVDDDEDIRDILAMAVRSLGYAVTTATDGLDALQKLSEGPRPSLILLDMMMPRMDGEAMLTTLRSNSDTRDIPVVLVSGHAAVGFKAAEFHADGYLVKPIGLDVLARTVEAFAGRTAESRGVNP